MLDLSQFYGTENYYKASILYDLKLTDGVEYLRQKGNCFWLIDIIGSYQYKLKNESFQVWKLRKLNDNWEVTCTDGNYKKLIKQKLEYSEFEEQTGLTEIELFLEGGVVMLPSER